MDENNYSFWFLGSEPQSVQDELLRRDYLDDKCRCHTSIMRDDGQGMSIIYVPSCQLSRYFFCSFERSSISMPIEASLSEATVSSISSETSYTAGASFVFCFANHSHASACVEKLISMTLAGCPSAAARFTSRPSANR